MHFKKNLIVFRLTQPIIKKIYFLLAFSFIIFSAALCFAEDQNLRIHFLDVGEGDAIFIQTPQNKTILLDAGNLITGYKVVEYLRKHSIQNINHLIFTHHDLDHIGGAFFILQMMDVENIYDNGYDLTDWMQGSDVYRWYSDIVRENNSYQVINSGDNFIEDGVGFSVLWPSKANVPYDFNANSLVIMIEFEEFKCLLTGDLTIRAERELLKSSHNLNSELLKVSHHGHSDATSQEFLKAVSPQVSVISVNKENIRDYPSEEVLERLVSFGSQVYRTDEYGDIIVEANKDGTFQVDH